MTKNTAEFSQFTDAVPCRVYTLPRDEDTSEPKGWIRGNTKIGPALENTTSCLQGKYEWKSELRLWIGPFSLVGQNLSWLDQINTHLNYNEQETS